MEDTVTLFFNIWIEISLLVQSAVSTKGISLPHCLLWAVRYLKAAKDQDTELV